MLKEDWKKARNIFYQSFYIYSVLHDDINIELGKKNLKEFFNIDIL